MSSLDFSIAWATKEPAVSTFSLIVSFCCTMVSKIGSGLFCHFVELWCSKIGHLTMMILLSQHHCVHLGIIEIKFHKTKKTLLHVSANRKAICE